MTNEELTRELNQKENSARCVFFFAIPDHHLPVGKVGVCMKRGYCSGMTRGTGVCSDAKLKPILFEKMQN